MDELPSSASQTRVSPERRFLLDVLSSALVADADRRRVPSLGPGQAAKAMRAPPGPRVGREETLLLFTGGRSLASTARKPALSGGIAGIARSGAGDSRRRVRTRSWTAKGLPGLMDAVLRSELAAGTLDLGAGREPQRSSATDFFSKKGTFEETRDSFREGEPSRSWSGSSTSSGSSAGRTLHSKSYSALWPPDGWRSTTTCEDKIKGSHSTCKVNNTTGVWSRVFRNDLDAAADSLKIKNATEGEEDLILHAWAVLQDNIDLARWAVCWVTGRNDAWDCLFKHLEGQKRTTIRMKDGDKKSFTAGPTRGIRIYRGHNRWLNYLLGWYSGKASVCGLDRQDAACLALDLAVTLLHESIHVCARATGDDADDCRKSYLVENIFRWALMKRYSSVDGSKCRSPFIGEVGKYLFADDGLNWGHDCINEQRTVCFDALTRGFFS